MFRIIPIILLGIMTMYFYTVLLRINSWGEFNFSKLVVIIILLLIMIPGINIFGIWFLILLHLFEIGIVIEILNLILKKIDLKGWSFLYNSFSLPILLTFLLFCYGYYNINNIKRVEYNIFTEKNISEKGYKIGFISDIHYGNSLNMEKLEKVVEKLNKENLDFLILGGDIVDEGTTLQGVKEVFKILGKIKNRYGLYFIYGNHDMSRYTKKPNYILKELKEAIGKENIYILEDKGIDINEDINLVGRKDRIFKNKKDSEELIKEVDKNKYIIVVSHQPTDLEKNSKLGYNLQISGHTHNGQIFPFNLLIKFFNLAELIYGQKEFENFNVIVTSGLSGWGYPIRTAGNSEYVIINILRKEG